VTKQIIVAKCFIHKKKGAKLPHYDKKPSRDQTWEGFRGKFMLLHVKLIPTFSIIMITILGTIFCSGATISILAAAQTWRAV
jgi:hypothetical protein